MTRKEWIEKYGGEKYGKHKPYSLYRHFDAEGNLLYVGISLSAIARLYQHRQSSEWFREIAMVTIETFPSKEAALEAERIAIGSEHPIYNKKLSICLSVVPMDIYLPDDDEDEAIIQSDKKWILGQWERMGYLTLPNGKHQHELTGEII